MTHRLTLDDARDLAVEALTASGAGDAAADSVATAVVAAHAGGRTNVGFQHLPFYCRALRRGAVDGRAEPFITQPRPGLMRADARSGFTHYAFDQSLERFTTAVRSQGVAVLSIANTYTCGCLGYFPERLAERGFAALAATNAGPAMVAPSGAAQPAFSTNPLAFALPRDGRAPLLIDQSTSACTLVDVHAARERGEAIPDAWALDADGRPTQDPEAALAGSFLPFGGYRGANIALLVELLAAGMSGGNWSIDAPSFAEGSACPDVGQWFMAIDLEAMDGAAGRIDRYLDRLAGLGTHIPGQSRQQMANTARHDGITLDDEVYETIQALCRRPQ
jgi:(2R)-3-sulfolactate dehydrogenase (NADP+)